MTDETQAATQGPPASETPTQEAPAATAQTGTEQVGQTTEAEAKPDSEGNDAQGAPDAYEGFTLPEGYTLDGERLEMTQALFKDVGLTQANAQKLIDAFVKVDGENQGAVKVLLEQERAQKVEQWATQTKSALGDKYGETTALAKTAVNAIGDPDLLEAFNTEGWGDHPALVKAFAFFGKLARDSSTDGLGGATGSARPKNIADRLFGTD